MWKKRRPCEEVSLHLPSPLTLLWSPTNNTCDIIQPTKLLPWSFNPLLKTNKQTTSWEKNEWKTTQVLHNFFLLLQTGFKKPLLIMAEVLPKAEWAECKCRFGSSSVETTNPDHGRYNPKSKGCPEIIPYQIFETETGFFTLKVSFSH